MKRLTKKQMWIFAIGQLGWSILGGIINAWLVAFYLINDKTHESGVKFLIPSGLIIGGFLTV
jgi:GPH family glycoside/pentoside/hexuronide:cation symporter